MLDNSTIKGVYLVEKKYDLIWLKDSKSNNIETTKYFTFESYLHQKFDENKIAVILEELNCDRKVIVDFDKGIAKKVIDKDYDFIKTMQPFFNAKYIQQQLDDPFSEQLDMYDPSNSKKGGFSI